MNCVFCFKKTDIHCLDCDMDFCNRHHGLHNLIKKGHAIKFQARMGVKY